LVLNTNNNKIKEKEVKLLKEYNNDDYYDEYDYSEEEDYYDKEYDE